ncbi:MAG: arylesterase [Acidobacteria bacterium]|nr:arylesterase [Acidobacteriota bacterium]
MRSLALLVLLLATPAPAQAPAPLVVFLGDSLTAGLGLAEAQAYPALVARELAAKGTPIRVVNAGVSGDTSAGGLRRADWVLKQKPQILVLALGANDGLRGVPVEDTEKNLRAIVAKGKAAGARVLFCGILVPTNYGPDYSKRFAEMFPRVARDTGVAFLPFLLEGVAGKPELNQRDGVHPNAKGQEILAKSMIQALQPLLSAP